jgi:hypothetical protein
MNCNIDARGKAIRKGSGILGCTIGLALCASAFVGPMWPCLGAGIASLLAGGFLIFESRMGWCVLRALGIKTPF